MRALGVHQGLAPVLDVVRDPRWGRVEECISEDPYLVGTLGTAYVRGLQAAGVIATLKHFVGYSASQAGRNFAPVHAGPREVADVLLVPFEMAVLDGGARSVMHSYAEIDGVPVAADPAPAHRCCCATGGGSTARSSPTTSASRSCTPCTASPATSATRPARRSPPASTSSCPPATPTSAPLAAAVARRPGRRRLGRPGGAAGRCGRRRSSGLLDATFDDAPPDEQVDLDRPEHRAIAARLAEESVVLLSNDGILPLAAPGAGRGRRPQRRPRRGAVRLLLLRQPRAAHSTRARARHRRPDGRSRRCAPSCRTPRSLYARGLRGRRRRPDRDRRGRRGRRAPPTSPCVVVGDQAGLFGRGTVGEGCDRDDLELPGVQRRARRGGARHRHAGRARPAHRAARTRSAGRSTRCAAVVQAFFPGEEGGRGRRRACSPAGSTRPAGCRSACRGRPARSRTRYLHPRARRGVDGEQPRHRARRCRSGTGCRYTTFAHERLAGARPRGRHRGRRSA